jgi:hypothetical protein
MQKLWKTSLPPKGIKLSISEIGNFWEYTRPALVHITSDQPIVASTSTWWTGSGIFAGWSFSCLPATQTKGKVFWLPVGDLKKGCACIANPNDAEANVKVRIYDYAGSLKKETNLSLPPKGVMDTYKYKVVSSIYSYGKPAQMLITSDLEVLVTFGVWQSDSFSISAAHGFTVLQ